MVCSILVMFGLRTLMLCSILFRIGLWTHKKQVRRIVMYADIAAHRVMRSLFLRLTVNDVMSAPVVEHRNQHVRIRFSCVVITTL